MKKIFQSLAFGALAATFALPALALGHSSAAPVTLAAAAQDAQVQDPAKAELYKKFTDNRKTNQVVAYEAAKEYLGKYTEDDQYTQYLKKWVASYEKGARVIKLNQLIYTDKNYGEAFSTGKQVLAEDPENLKALIDLGFAGYSAAAATKADTYNAEAIGYAKRAIQLIESGKAPDDWKPFKGKDDTLAYLYYAVGILNFKNNPNDSIPALIRATQFESDLKKNAASTYFLLATSYESGPYKSMSKDFTDRYQGKPETDESRLALANLNQVIDRIIDAYARAVAAAGNDPKKADWLKRLTELYKFRHENSDTGLNAFVAGINSTPLPPPPTPITTLPTTTPPATGTGNGAGDGASTGTTASPSGTTPATTPAQPARPAATTPATSVPPGNRTAPATTTAKPAATAKPKTAHARRP